MPALSSRWIAGRELATPHHPWLPPVYKETLGWVHLSINHLRAAWQVTGDQFSAGVPLRPDVIPGSHWLALLAAMIKVTEQLFGYVERWESRQGLPLGQARGWPQADPAE